MSDNNITFFFISDLQQAQEATEEVKRKVLIGAVSFKKADEKKDSFKRSSLVGRRRVRFW